MNNFSEIKCPECGYIDSLENFNSSGNTLECPECESRFSLIPILLTVQAKLQIPKWVATGLDEIYKNAFYDDISDEEGYRYAFDLIMLENLWDERIKKWAMENQTLAYAYINPLTRPFVEVVG